MTPTNLLARNPSRELLVYKVKVHKGLRMSRREDEERRLASYLCPETDSLGTTGVILSDEIEEYVRQFKLIDPFDPKNLKAAGYELTVGRRHAIGGDFGELMDGPGKNEVIIPPFEVLIIQTTETVNLPRFLIGIWNIRVAWAYKGLLWVGGPQVDPGYVGYLYCPIYNLSNREVTLKLGEPIALLGFLKTTPFKGRVSVEYSRPPRRILFEDYNPNELKSALFTEAGEKLRVIENEIEQFKKEIEEKITKSEAKLERSTTTIETRLNSITATTFTALAILVGSLSILVGSVQRLQETFPWWFYLSIIFSIVAIVIASLALKKSRGTEPKPRSEKSESSNKTTKFVVLILSGTTIFLLWKIFW